MQQIAGQFNKKKSAKDVNHLEGLGRKLKLGKNGTVREGNFIKNTLNGFGRCIASDGTMAIGFFKNDLFHGYGKRVDKDGSVEEKLFNQVDWQSGETIGFKDSFVGYNEYDDFCAQKLDFKKYVST